jgi:WD40 repeat protein
MRLNLVKKYKLIVFYLVTFSKDNKFLISGSYNNTLKLWNIWSCYCIRTFNGHSDIVNSVKFSNDID